MVTAHNPIQLNSLPFHMHHLNDSFHHHSNDSDLSLTNHSDILLTNAPVIHVAPPSPTRSDDQDSTSSSQHLSNTSTSSITSPNSLLTSHSNPTHNHLQRDTPNHSISASDFPLPPFKVPHPNNKLLHSISDTSSKQITLKKKHSHSLPPKSPPPNQPLPSLPALMSSSTTSLLHSNDNTNHTPICNGLVMPLSPKSSYTRSFSYSSSSSSSSSSYTQNDSNTLPLGRKFGSGTGTGTDFISKRSTSGPLPINNSISPNTRSETPPTHTFSRLRKWDFATAPVITPDDFPQPPSPTRILSTFLKDTSKESLNSLPFDVQQSINKLRNVSSKISNQNNYSGNLISKGLTGISLPTTTPSSNSLRTSKSSPALRSKKFHHSRIDSADAVFDIGKFDITDDPLLNDIIAPSLLTSSNILQDADDDRLDRALDSHISPRGPKKFQFMPNQQIYSRSRISMASSITTATSSLSNEDIDNGSHIGSRRSSSSVTWSRRTSSSTTTSQNSSRPLGIIGSTPHSLANALSKARSMSDMRARFAAIHSPTSSAAAKYGGGSERSPIPTKLPIEYTKIKSNNLGLRFSLPEDTQSSKKLPPGLRKKMSVPALKSPLMYETPPPSVIWETAETVDQETVYEEDEEILDQENINEEDEIIEKHQRISSSSSSTYSTSLISSYSNIGSHIAGPKNIARPRPSGIRQPKLFLARLQTHAQSNKKRAEMTTKTK